jgi:hypothetical protein
MTNDMQLRHDCCVFDSAPSPAWNRTGCGVFLATNLVNAFSLVQWAASLHLQAV